MEFIHLLPSLQWVLSEAESNRCLSGNKETMNKGWGTPWRNRACLFGGNILQKPAYPNCWTEAPQNIKQMPSRRMRASSSPTDAHRGSHCCTGREKFLKNKTCVRKNWKRFMFLFYNHTLRHGNCVSQTAASWPLVICLFLSWANQSNFRCSHNHFYSGPHLPPPGKCCFLLYLKKISKINLKDSILQADIHCQCKLTPSVSIWFTFHTHSEDPGTKVDVLILL